MGELRIFGPPKQKFYILAFKARGESLSLGPEALGPKPGTAPDSPLCCLQSVDLLEGKGTLFLVSFKAYWYTETREPRLASEGCACVRWFLIITTHVLDWWCGVGTHRPSLMIYNNL